MRGEPMRLSPHAGIRLSDRNLSPEQKLTPLFAPPDLLILRAAPHSWLQDKINRIKGGQPDRN